MASGFPFKRAVARVCAEMRLPTSRKARVRRFSPTLSLYIEQSPSHQKQMCKRCGHLKSVQVFCQASVTHFLKAEDSLDDPKHVLDLGPYAGLTSVGRFDRLVYTLSPPVALVGEVLRLRRTGADRRPLSFLGLITPDSSFLPVKQVLQRVTISHIGCRGQIREHELCSAVHSDVRFHAEKAIVFPSPSDASPDHACCLCSSSNSVRR